MSTVKFSTKEAQEIYTKYAHVLSPNLLWGWFLWVTEIARPSGSLDGIRAALKAAGARIPGVVVREDAVGNVCLSKAATAGHEKDPGIIVQAHMDMVVAHDESVRPNFVATRDGISVDVRDDGWVYAHGTSLGADDGIGVATCLALLEDPSVAATGHPVIDCLFTVNEETTMEGAEMLDSSIITPGARYLINVDNEDDSMLCLGSSGGGDVTIKFDHERKDTNVSNETAITISVSGFAGGHTGVEIDKYRANAVKVLSANIAYAQKTVSGKRKCGKFVRIAELNGGVFNNALPITACATVVVPKGDIVAEFCDAVLASFENTKKDYVSIENPDALKITVENSAKMPAKAFDASFSSKILSFWVLAPSAPLRMSPDVKGMVETSCAFSIAKVAQEGPCTFVGLARTSRDTTWNDLECMAEALADIVDGTGEISGKFLGWLPEPESRIAKVAQQAHLEALGRPCVVYAIHAGLECGMIMQKVPEIEAISIGPKVEFPHTTQERCNIHTVTTYYDWVVKIVEHLSAKN